MRPEDLFMVVDCLGSRNVPKNLHRYQLVRLVVGEEYVKLALYRPGNQTGYVYLYLKEDGWVLYSMYVVHENLSEGGV